MSRPPISMSRASTVTLAAESPAPSSASQSVTASLVVLRAEPKPIPYELLDNRLDNNDLSSKRLIIAVDFGTTYSAVSFAALAEGESGEIIGLERIRSIHNYPYDVNFADDRMKHEVPTEVVYPHNRHFRTQEILNLAEAAGSDSEASGTEMAVHNDDWMDVDDVDEDFDTAMPDPDTSSFKWGYAVHKDLHLPHNHFDESSRPLSRFKLLLDTSQTTESIRNALAPTLETLKRRGVVRKGAMSIIADYLACLLGHAKAELQRGGYDDSYRTEMVLCVPAIWKQKACRTMQSAMAVAMQRIGFQKSDLQNQSIENLFIVSEPEAAAAYVLAMDNTVRPHDTFVLLDAGGGTVDANTYRVTQAEPLRLEHEVVEPGGGLHGASYINESFREHLKKRLKDETYLEQGKITINGIVETMTMNEFEYKYKRTFNMYNSSAWPGIYLTCNSALRENRKKGFTNQLVFVKFAKMREIFLKCLEPIGDIMEEQIEGAMAKDAKVNKVILIGGFAASPSLQGYLKSRLASFSARRSCDIKLVIKENNATAVSSGAVLRALNKEMGPKRHTKSSYGILRSEPFGLYPEHKHEGQKMSYDQTDGHPYIKSTIDWVLKKGVDLQSTWECEPFICSHVFPCFPPPKLLLCEEVLYVSDKATKSHYQKTHENNTDAEVVGKIIADFTFLRERGLILPTRSEILDKNGNLVKYVGKKHYRVDYTMQIKVVDRDLRCYAIYDNEIIQKCRINIAPALEPGAK